MEAIVELLRNKDAPAVDIAFIINHKIDSNIKDKFYGFYVTHDFASETRKVLSNINDPRTALQLSPFLKHSPSRRPRKQAEDKYLKISYNWSIKITEKG